MAKKDSQREITIHEKLTFSEFIASEYSHKLADNFGWLHLKKETDKRWEKYNPQVFIVKEDHYSLDFNVYIRYTIPEGLTFFTSYSYGVSSLTNAWFRQVTSVEFLADEGITEEYLNNISEDADLPRNIIRIEMETGWPRGDRKRLRNSCLTLTTNC